MDIRELACYFDGDWFSINSLYNTDLFSRNVQVNIRRFLHWLFIK
jgi:hypothetical protein